jgi:hypothetical protein
MEMVVPVRIDGCVSPHPVKIGKLHAIYVKEKRKSNNVLTAVR